VPALPEEMKAGAILGHINDHCPAGLCPVSRSACRVSSWLVPLKWNRPPL
jgi:hypothetical protein